jgi:predicted kinase
MVVIIMGLPGSGKSYFATRLAGLLRADYVSSDLLRKQMIQNRTYSEEEKEQVYREMLRHIRQALKQDKSLVLDATFYKNRIRRCFKMQDMKGGRIAFIEVTAPESLIKERLLKPRQDSEADYSTYKKLAREWEPYPGEHLVLQSARDNIDGMLQKTIEYLRGFKNGEERDKPTDA